MPKRSAGMRRRSLWAGEPGTNTCKAQADPMTERKSFLLRLPPGLMDELNRWAKDDLRSLNAQIEFLLREAARKRHRPTDDESNDQPTGT